jgi:hypothetical protein
MRYLTIGISLASLSCKKEVGEPLQQATYIYKNMTDSILKIEFHSKSNNQYLTKVLNIMDSIEITSSGSPGAFPFRNTQNGGYNSDSIIFRFKSNKCITNVLSSDEGIKANTGVFNLKEYDNYSQNLVNQKSYTLRYTIDSTDYKKAVPCK